MTGLPPAMVRLGRVLGALRPHLLGPTARLVVILLLTLAALGVLGADHGFGAFTLGFVLHQCGVFGTINAVMAWVEWRERKEAP